jgi:hypothetical protein
MSECGMAWVGFRAPVMNRTACFKEILAGQDQD